LAQDMTTLRCVGEDDRLVEWVVPTDLAERIARGGAYIELYGARPWRYSGEESVERLEADSATLRSELDRIAASDPGLISQRRQSSAERAVAERRPPYSSKRNRSSSSS
jgi:hypothetical protein